MVLVVNDHVLKGAGLLPGWLTGKLSDFAGLVVAPPLAAFLARARTPPGRALAFGAVIGWFCAVKVSPAAAEATEAVMGAVRIPWRLWSDPTDLVGLLVTPLAWRVRPALTPSGRLRRAVPAILGAAACLATSPEPVVGYHTSAFVENMTVNPLEILVYRAAGTFDCAELAADPATALSSSFMPESCTDVGPGGVLPIDRHWSPFKDTLDAGTPPVLDPDCDAVILRVRDLPDTLLVWGPHDYVDVERLPSYGDDHPLDPHGIYLERAGTSLFAAGSTLITSMPATVALADAACAALPNGRDGGTP